MLVLAIDTCEQRGSLSLLSDGVVHETCVHGTSEDYSIWLLRAVDEVLRTSKTVLVQVEAYAVSTGPGSFTGIRVGLATVKAWNEVYGRPIAAMSRLSVLARQADASSEFTATVIAAQRGQIFGALWKRVPETLQLMGEERALDVDDFLDSVVSQVGADRVSWVSTDPESIQQAKGWREREKHGDFLQTVSPVLAPAIGRIGAQMVLASETTDALSLDANYVRRPDAEIYWKGVPGRVR